MSCGGPARVHQSVQSANCNNSSRCRKSRNAFQVRKIGCDWNSTLQSSDEDSWFHRSLDGIGNNLRNIFFGAANTGLLRSSPFVPFGTRTTNPRVISNIVCDGPQTENSSNLTDMFWGYGQFIDHLLDLTPNGNVSANIIAPPDDPVAPNAVISLTRSVTLPDGNQPNVISAYIDSGTVYGTVSDLSYALRTLDGTGMMIGQSYAAGVFLPENTNLFPNEAMNKATPEEHFLAGDVRSNENVLLTGYHELFRREHNWQAERVRRLHPEWQNNDSRLWAEARKRTNAVIYAITYNEFLPLLLGPNSIPQYRGYDSTVNPGINHEFAHAAFRIGHTMVSETLQLGSNPANTLNLQDAFFNPNWVKANGIEVLFEGATRKRMQEIDTFIVPNLRSFLFGPNPPGMLLDLPSINIQRGRDHGLADYNTMRIAYGLKRLPSFYQINPNPDIHTRLSTAYPSTTVIDPWVGGLAEPKLPGAQVGELFHAVISDQFIRIRDGDRYWYENDSTLSSQEVEEISKTRLHDVIRRNFPGIDIPNNVFRL